MDNQHRKIKGYRDLSQVEIDAMNAVKEKAAEVGELISKLEGNDELDQRWVAIAKIDEAIESLLAIEHKEVGL